jgi:hypothetical protein
VKLGNYLNKTFGKAYILNLKSQKERKYLVKKNCDEINLDYKFVDGFDGIKFYKNSLRDFLSEKKNFNNTNFEYPVNVRYYASQMSTDVLIMNAINNDIKSFIHLNDDVYWSNYVNFTKENYDQIKNNLPKDWDIVILGNMSTVNRFNPSKGVEYINIPDLDTSGCHGIAINHTVYHDWLYYSFKREFIGDWLIKHLICQNKKVYIIKPDLCLQNRDIPSTMTLI